MSRPWLRRPTSSSASKGPGDDTETARGDGPSGSDDAVRALFVTGPNGGSRHVLPDGLVTLGRGAEATIVVKDPRVSRTHALLHVGTTVALSDAGSANGTYLGKKRLATGDAPSLTEGESFFIGDSALVVRQTSLRRSSPKRVTDLEEARQCLVTTAPLVDVGVRPLEKTQTWIPEAILGDVRNVHQRLHRDERRFLQ